MMSSPLLTNNIQRQALQYLRTVWHWASTEFAQSHGVSDTEGVRSVRYLGLLIHRSTRAAIAELDGGCNYGIPLLMRACLEALLNVNYLASDSALFEKRGAAFLLDQDRSRLRDARKLIDVTRRGNAPGLSEHTSLAQLEKLQTDLKDTIAAYEVAMGISPKDWPRSLEQRARQAGPESDELYASLYAHLSSDVHAQPLSLTTRTSAASGTLVVDPLPLPDELEAQLSALVDFYLRMLEHLEQKAGFPPLPPELRESMP
jgi:hypothetical protein